MNQKKQTEITVSAWVRVLGGMSLLIAMSALLLLVIQNGYAADGGFQPGGKGFNNPYAPSNAGSPPQFFDDDESDFEMDNSGNANYPPPGDMPAGANDGGGNGGPAVTRNAKGTVDIEGAKAGVIDGKNNQPLRVDAEGSAGSNEVVTDFNFPDADIMDIAKALGKLTGQNFILDKDVKGRITLISNSPITVKDAWRAFLTALDMNGFALIPSGKFIRIARQRDARDKQLRTYTGKYAPDSDALITRLFSLKFLSAEEVARNFRSFMPANSRIIPYEQTNTVIVTDTGSNIAKLAKLLEILDVETYDAGIEVIPVKYASAVELAKLVDQLIPGSSTGGAAGPRFPGGGGRSGFQSRKTKEGGIINTIIADERTNTMIVHANTKGADQVRELINKLDKKLPAALGGGKIHVIYLQFADAEQIANTLNNLAQGGTSTAPKTGPAGGTGVNPVQATLFEGNIKIAADKSTNSLVVTATGNDFVTLQQVVNRLDIPRDQVYAESYIMEISLRKQFQFSANILNPSSGIGSLPSADLASFITNPLSASGAIIGFKSGGPKSVDVGGKTVTVNTVQGLIKFLQTNTNATVLATPQILTLDNTEANFESAQKIPVLSQTVSNGTVSTGTTKEDVSISLKIKPAINKLSNFVKMDIEAKLQDISNQKLPDALANQAVAINSRTAKTSVVVADGDTVVLGGLVRDVANDTVAKIPVLGDIPVLGWLFRSKDSESTKSNLLIFITPKIIRQYEAVRAILDRKLKERDDFLERSVGGVDIGKDFRDKIIRSLPDMAKIKNEKPTTNFTIDNGTDQMKYDEGQNGGASYRPSSSNNSSQLAPVPAAPNGPPAATPVDPGFAPPPQGGVDFGAPPPVYDGGQG
ncbi:MAG: type II secretion system secretin GspD [Bdellovibrionales bacterium]|nr:type II secretion system secretin GspD [Bdellovibrionales bacterium]